MKNRGQLSGEIQAKIRDLIVSGSLPAGSRLREEALASRFRASRTPLRQALIALEGEGLVQSRPNAGFAVLPLSAEEAASLYPIVWTLEALAVEEAFDLLRSSTKKLEQINKLFLKSRRRPAKAHELDAQFHHALVLPSSNERLKEMIQTEKKKLARYEQFYMGDSGQVEKSASGHSRIIDAIDSGNRAKAKEALIENWRQGMWVILSGIRGL